MAFGLLGSIIPQVNRNEVFYTASFPNLTIGKVSISSKNYNPVKVRLGITTDNLNVEYLVYNKFINYGETFETDIIHLGNSEKLIARSTDPNVNFLFYGETINESVNPVKSGLLASVRSTNTQKKVLYTAPQNSNAIVTLSVCNLDSQPGKARIGISDAGLNAFDSSEYLEYDVEIGPNQTYTRTEIKLDQGQTLVCSSSDDSNIDFVCHGRLFYGVQGDEDLYVVGNGFITGSLTVGRSISGIVTSSSLNQSLINLGSLPAIDGSRLSGVVATSSGVAVQDDGSPLGAASTINFGSNLSAIYQAGISTVSLSDSVNISQNFSVATNKFSVDGSNGNTQVAGTLSVSSNINALNNKVTNVGTATSITDATNKSYVDTRSIAMSIALS